MPGHYDYVKNTKEPIRQHTIYTSGRGQFMTYSDDATYAVFFSFNEVYLIDLDIANGHNLKLLDKVLETENLDERHKKMQSLCYLVGELQ